MVIALFVLLVSCQQMYHPEEQTQVSSVVSVQFSLSKEGPQTIYRNDTFDYEIRFSEEKVELVPNQIFERGTEGNPSFRIRSGGHFALGVWDNSQKMSAKNWLDQQYMGYSGGWIGKVEEFRDLPVKAYRAYREATFDPEAPTYIEYIIVPKGEKFYTFGLEINAKDSAPSLQVFRNVVTSFRFINQ